MTPEEEKEKELLSQTFGAQLRKASEELNQALYEFRQEFLKTLPLWMQKLWESIASEAD